MTQCLLVELSPHAYACTPTEELPGNLYMTLEVSGPSEDDDYLEEWMSPKEILCNASAYYRKIFRGKDLPKPRVLELPHQSPRAANKILSIISQTEDDPDTRLLCS